MIEIGRVCVKTSGREAGKYCVVVKKIDREFVLITGPRDLTGVKRRRCNIRHLEPLPFKLKIKEEESDENVLKELEKEGVIEKLKIVYRKKKVVENIETERKRKEKKVKKTEKIEKK